MRASSIPNRRSPNWSDAISIDSLPVNLVTDSQQ
jgi:hypothetical protein